MQDEPPHGMLATHVTYRVWVYTSSADPPGRKGDVSLCLHGALGSVWLQQLQAMQPSAAGTSSIFHRRIGRGGRSSEGGSGTNRCELFVSAPDVGTLQRLTLAYAHSESDDGCKPWWLQQVIVRHGIDGVVAAFPASCELRGPRALLELLPRLSWHEDTFGNCAEAAPPLPPAGWHWPALQLQTAANASADDEYKASEQDALHIHLYRELLEQEVLPLVDSAVHSVAMQRTPGTFLHECTAAAAGAIRGSATEGSMDELHRCALSHNR